MKKSNAGGRHASLEALRDALRKFASDRDWNQFHSPKNLAIALNVEAAELLEHFQWMSEAASSALDPEQRSQGAGGGGRRAPLPDSAGRQVGH